MRKLQKALYLSEKGYQDLKKAIVACIITNLTMLFPFMITVMIFQELLNPLINGTEMNWNRLWILWIIGIVAAIMVFLAASRILLLLLKNAPLQIPMIKIIAATATAPIVHMIFFSTFLPDFPFVLVISPIVTSSFSLICFHLSNFP